MIVLGLAIGIFILALFGTPLFVGYSVRSVTLVLSGWQRLISPR